MKKTIWRSAWLVLSLALLPLRCMAEDDDSPVHNEMEAISRSMRKLSRQYADADQKASSLELVATILKHAQAAQTLIPSKAVKLEGDAKAKYLETFHKDLEALITELSALKDAINSGKADAVKAEMDKIMQLKGMSHKELGVGGDKKRIHEPPPPGQ